MALQNLNLRPNCTTTLSGTLAKKVTQSLEILCSNSGGVAGVADLSDEVRALYASSVGRYYPLGRNGSWK